MLNFSQYHLLWFITYNIFNERDFSVWLLIAQLKINNDKIQYTVS